MDEDNNVHKCEHCTPGFVNYDKTDHCPHCGLSIFLDPIEKPIMFGDIARQLGLYAIILNKDPKQMDKLIEKLYKDLK